MSDAAPDAERPHQALPEIALPGGLGSGGAVVRVGDTVRRPLRPHSASVGRFLDHLHTVGFAGAPQVLGRDAQGREVLTWMPGEVAIPPFPAWAASEELLVSVAELQRGLHAAAASFEVRPDDVWDRANLPPAGADAIVCHNDLCIENVVVEAGRAVAVIDFDFAAPGSRRYDIAIAARHWVPVKDPVDLAPDWQGLDQIARFRRFCDGHRLGAADRRGLVTDLVEFLDRALVSMRTRAEEGRPGYVEIWAAGYPDQNRRARDFVTRHAEALAG